MDGSVMSARLVLLTTDGTGWPALPAATTDAQGAAVYVGELVLPGAVGDYPAREYRSVHDSDRLLVLVRLATRTISGTTYALCVVWVPAPARDGAAPHWDALLACPAIAAMVRKSWALSWDGSAYTCPALDADGTAVGTAVKSAWPTWWRALLPTDPQPTYDASGVQTSPGGPPTGPVWIASVLA